MAGFISYIKIYCKIYNNNETSLGAGIEKCLAKMFPMLYKIYMCIGMVKNV